MVLRSKIGTLDQGILVPFPAQAVISDFVLMCLSSLLGLKQLEVRCVFAHPTCSLKIPAGMGIRIGLRTRSVSSTPH